MHLLKGFLEMIENVHNAMVTFTEMKHLKILSTLEVQPLCPRKYVLN
jgi:hypothetical protein